ncbi:MAG: TVP38/TMEM64 family protein [Alphaproteobacteria bacterium]
MRQLWPAVALVVVVLGFFLFGPDNQVVFETLRAHRGALLRFVEANVVASWAIYFVIYVVVVAFSLPGGAMMTVAGGFLFGPVRAAIYVVFAATLGATLLFLIARSAVGDRLEARAGPWLVRMEKGFRENALSYLLVLRLIPLFPFFVVNLVPAFLGVGLRTYVVATFFGIIPGTIVFALAGSGLGSAFDAGDGFDIAMVLTPEIIAALIGLGLLALMPVVYKKLHARRPRDAEGPEDASRLGDAPSGGE